jgi:xanthine dehydrogenase iron-sulfur cluster and FAD-binding subunit A
MRRVCSWAVGAAAAARAPSPSSSLAKKVNSRADGQRFACLVTTAQVSSRLILMFPSAVRSINSCLAPVGSLVGCAVVTAAGMGSSASGFHPVQGKPAQTSVCFSTD